MIQPFEASGAVGGDDPPAWDPAADLAKTPLEMRTSRVFGTPAFFRLWLAQVVSATGDWLGLMAIIALTAAVSQRAEGVAVGLVLGARVAPGFFLAPWAGVLVDRWDRKKVMITCDLARAGVMIALPFVNSVPGLIAASLVLEVFTLLWSPAKEASVPRIRAIPVAASPTLMEVTKASRASESWIASLNHLVVTLSRGHFRVVPPLNA